MLSAGMLLAGRYEIESMIGAGGMSDVYKAKDHSLNRYVAIKVLKSEFAEDRIFVAKFRTEAQSAAGLEHPNIVNIYDVGQEGALYYIVMEYVEGITLKTYIGRKKCLSFKETVSIAIQVSRGIDCAHSKNIVHRDIKPQNIMISTDGKVKVTDFGIAKAASANTVGSDVMGSVHYASPEQARSGYVDARSDIYSLGIVMFEMITGRVPFDGETAVAVAIQHLQEEMKSPRCYAPDLPVSLEKIILKCTQKSPDRRYQSMNDLILDLRKALANPDLDFVVIPPVIDGGTKMVTPDERRQMREKTFEKNAASASAETEKKSPKTEEETNYKKPRRADPVDEDGEEEEDDDKVLNPKLDKAVNIAMIVIGVAMVLVIGYLLLSIFGGVKFPFFSGNDTAAEAVTETETETQAEEESQTAESEATVEVPDVTRYSLEEACSMLEACGLSGYAYKYDLASLQEPGTVTEQDIDPGTAVAAGTQINLTIAGEAGQTAGDSTDTSADSGSMVTVPSVNGYSESNAVNTIQSVGLTAVKQFEYSEIAAGTVIGQNPAGGNSVQSGSIVTLIISQGKKSATVPSVVGMTEADARNTLSSADLSASVSYAYSDTVADGLVISSSPAAGKTVESGTSISVTVSMGKEDTSITVPSVTGISSSEATRILKQYGFKVSVSESYNDSVAEGTVISQSIPGGSSAESGATVTITVSKGPEPGAQPEEENPADDSAAVEE